jgi:hypothetical protein
MSGSLLLAGSMASPTGFDNLRVPCSRLSLALRDCEACPYGSRRLTGNQVQLHEHAAGSRNLFHATGRATDSYKDRT